jgi:hypothetical protein
VVDFNWDEIDRPFLEHCNANGIDPASEQAQSVLLRHHAVLWAYAELHAATIRPHLTVLKNLIAGAETALKALEAHAAALKAAAADSFLCESVSPRMTPADRTALTNGIKALFETPWISSSLPSEEEIRTEIESASQRLIGRQRFVLWALQFLFKHLSGTPETRTGRGRPKSENQKMLEDVVRHFLEAKYSKRKTAHTIAVAADGVWAASHEPLWEGAPSPKSEAVRKRLWGRTVDNDSAREDRIAAIEERVRLTTRRFQRNPGSRPEGGTKTSR